MELPKDTTIGKGKVKWRCLDTDLDEFSYTNSNHDPTLVQTIVDKGSQDCVIKAGQEQFHVQREVMSLVSNYFEASLRFESMNIESSPNTPVNCVEVKLEDTNGETIKLLIDYAYTGKLITESKNVLDILKISEFLLMDTVCDACVTYFTDRLDFDDSAIEFLEYAKNIGIVKLINGITTFIARHFYRFSANETYLKISMEFLVEILRYDKLVIMDKLPSGEKDEFMFVDHKAQEELVYDLVYKYAVETNNEELFADILLKTARPSEVSTDSRYSWKTMPRDLSDVLILQWSEPLACQECSEWRDAGDFDDSSMVTPECPIIYITFLLIHKKKDRNISGLTIKYSNGRLVQHGDTTVQYPTDQHILLHLDERITHVNVIAVSGMVVDSLIVKTNKLRRFPFRGGGECGIDVERPCSSAYLAFVKGKIAKRNLDTGIRHLQFGWVYCRDVM